MNEEGTRAEVVFDDSSSVVVNIRRKLPDFLQSVKLKYVKLGYGYACKPATLIIFLIVSTVVVNTTFQLTDMGFRLFSDMLTAQKPVLDIATIVVTAAPTSIMLLLVLYWSRKQRPRVYLVDFACCKPEDGRKISVDAFMQMTVDTGFFSQQSIDFQAKVSHRSGLGDETALPTGVTNRPPNLCVDQSRSEAESVMYDAVESLLRKTGVKPEEIGILIVNCSLFCPIPSLSSMIVNRFKLRSDIKTFNLSGMGCSAGLISIDLAKHMLAANPNAYVVVVSTESVTLNWYFGNDRSMLLSNCIFRMGCGAILLSNKCSDRKRSKYQLLHTVRTHGGNEDKSYNCVIQREDDKSIVGISLAKDLTTTAGEALKANITTLGPLVLPLSEQALFLMTLLKRKVLGMKVRPYIPDFKLAFDHFCIHAGGRAVLDSTQMNMKLTDENMEASRMTLHRFGNTSSSSLWYGLSYAEAKGRVLKGHRVWQIGFGSGFKCNSAVWRALGDISAKENGNPWMDCIDRYPVKVPAFI